MTHKYFFTRCADHEEVLHIGETGTLVNFRNDSGIALTLAEMKRQSGQPVMVQELSSDEFLLAKEAAVKESVARERMQTPIMFEL